VRPLFRPLAPADQPAVAALWHDAWHDGHGQAFPPEIVAMRKPHTFALRLEDLRADSLVAELDGRIVAFATLQNDEIDQFFLAPEVRGSGLAAELLSVAEQALLARGIVEAVVQCTVGNERARRFYARRGWQERGIEDLPIWMPDERIMCHPTHVFTKTLAARRTDAQG